MIKCNNEVKSVEDRGSLCVRLRLYPQYVGLELQFAGRGRVHEAEQCPHVVVSAGRQDELLDDEQGVFPTLPVLHDVVNATSAAKLPEQSWKTEKK